MRTDSRHVHFGLAIAVLLPLTYSSGALAQANLNAALRGDYTLAATRVCLTQAVETTPGIFSSSGTPESYLHGTLTYNGSGGVSFVGQESFTPLGGGQGPAGTGVTLEGVEFFFHGRRSLNCNSGTYSVNADGSFTQQLNCNMVVVGGATSGSTATLNGFSLEGRVAHDGTVLTIESLDIAISHLVESLTWITFFVDGESRPLPAPFPKRICKGNGVATSRR